jgi:hypothetical protein
MSFAQIHREFSKIAGNWDKMTREDQEAYLQRHKKSRRRMTAGPETRSEVEPKADTKEKFTFKTEKPTGRYRSFFKPSHHIKINGVDVGTIGAEPPHKIRLMVVKQDIMEDNNPNCTWKWIQLTKESASVDEAKVWLNSAINAIKAKYKLACIS